MAMTLVPGIGLIEGPTSTGWFIAPNGLVYFQINSSLTPRLMLLGVG